MAQTEQPKQKEKKRRRIFPWFFLAVQVLFLIWLITGVNSTDCAPGDDAAPPGRESAPV